MRKENINEKALREVNKCVKQNTKNIGILKI